MTMLLIPMFVTSLLLTPSQTLSLAKREVHTTTCGEKRLRAADYPRPFTSPNFPRKFSDQTQCSWLIRSAPGTRVKVYIQDFSLLSPDGGNTCIKQFVRFHDPYTNMFVGPFCGNTNIAPIVSSANELRVWLESNTVGIKGNYRGFKMSYKETMEPTSDSMKDPAKMYRKMNTAKPQQIVTMPTMVPTDNRVDLNNNAAIDAENKKLNEEASKRNSANANMEQMIKDMTKANLLRTQKAIYKTPPPSLTKRIMKGFPRRTTQAPAHVRPYIPSNHVTEQEQPAQNGMNKNAIAATVCGILVLVAVGVFIFFKIRKSKDDKPKTKSVTQPNDKIISTLPGIETNPTKKLETKVEVEEEQRREERKKVMNKQEQETLNVVKNETILPRNNHKRSHRQYEEIKDVLKDSKHHKIVKPPKEHSKVHKESVKTQHLHSKKRRENSKQKQKRESRSKNGNKKKSKLEKKSRDRRGPAQTDESKKEQAERLPRRAERKSESNRTNRRHRSLSAEKRKRKVDKDAKKRSKSVGKEEPKHKSRKHEISNKKYPKSQTRNSEKKPSSQKQHSSSKRKAANHKTE